MKYMDKLVFAIAGVDAKTAYFNHEYDFVLHYDKKRNSATFNSWYRLYACPKQEGGPSVYLGRIWISSSRQRTYSFHIMPSDPRIEPNDILGRELGVEKPFERIPNRYQSLIGEDVAKKLFVLLSPTQRNDFIESLHICNSEEDYEKGKEERTLPIGTIKQFNNWQELQKIIPTQKYLDSDIDYRRLIDCIPQLRHWLK